MAKGDKFQAASKRRALLCCREEKRGCERGERGAGSHGGGGGGRGRVHFLWRARVGQRRRKGKEGVARECLCVVGRGKNCLLLEGRGGSKDRQQGQGNALPRNMVAGKKTFPIAAGPEED